MNFGFIRYIELSPWNDAQEWTIQHVSWDVKLTWPSSQMMITSIILCLWHHLSRLALSWASCNPLHVAFVATVIDNVRRPSSGYTCPLTDLLRTLPQWIFCCFHGYWWRCMAFDSVGIALLLSPCFVVEHAVFYNAQCENECYTIVSPKKVSHLVHYSQGFKFEFWPFWTQIWVQKMSLQYGCSYILEFQM